MLHRTLLLLITLCGLASAHAQQWAPVAPGSDRFIRVDSLSRSGDSVRYTLRRGDAGSTALTSVEVNCSRKTRRDVIDAAGPPEGKFYPADATPAMAEETAYVCRWREAVGAGRSFEHPYLPAVPSAETQRMQAELDALRQQLRQAQAGQPVREEPPPPAAMPRMKVRALVIGNSNYLSFGRLANPGNDATAIAAKLRSLGIASDLVLDADRDTFVRALNEHAARARDADVSILYYAGHGVQVDGTNYLIPTNMSADGISAGYVKLNALSLNAVLDYFPARTKIVFLDACRDNPVSRSLLAVRSTASIGLAPVSANSGTLIAYATRDGSVAEDGKGKHSPYTAALLEHLDKPLDIGVVLRQVRRSVMHATSNRQEPWEYGSLVGDQLVLSQIAR